MESKYGDDDGQPSSFSPLYPFVTTTVFKVSFCEVKCCVVLFCLSPPLGSGGVLPMFSLSTLWFVVVLKLVVFLWIPYQDVADKEETTHNDEAAR
jgi:hypothetical protein